MLDENSINEILTGNNTVENTTTENFTIQNTVQETNTVTLETIHNDLGFICSFLVIASVIIFMIILYKLFSMFF